MKLEKKLAILADAAKYDASCASGGTVERSSKPGAGMGSTGRVGVCHSYTPDGRCVSLLKILLTNFCIYECGYCVNRKSSNVQRARFTIDEVVRLTLDFYRRNYIEGLFLSSGIIQNPDYTMEQLVAVARSLREEHDFRGYIHLKTIPDASPELVDAAGRYADRISINVELPTQKALDRLAPEKKLRTIKLAMAKVRAKIDEKESEPNAPDFAPAGQSTQMIVGAEPSDDKTILATSATLYSAYKLRRVYYSAFSPIREAAANLPIAPPPLMREHRLYQADWLLRFYGFDLAEIAAGNGMLDLDIDPKLAWALRNPNRFPVDINTAPREQLLRVPALGTRTVDKILSSRRFHTISFHDLGKLKLPLQKISPFIVAPDHRPPRQSKLPRFPGSKRAQFDLFSTA
jgi:putative DNA modification/repair radical SAM protein